jgi:hypothetical protein
MDLMQMAGHLSLEFDAYVTGPDTLGGKGRTPYTMAQVIAKNGRGIGITVYDGTPPYPSGPLNVWGIEETGTRSATWDSRTEAPMITSWCVRSAALRDGVEYSVTFERIRDVMREISAMEPLPHKA